VTGATGAGPPAGQQCAQPGLSASYVRNVDRALRSGEDLWGNALLARPGGPTYERVRRHLTPLLLARAEGGEPLTESGFHYLALAYPSSPDGSGSAALHVADGSQVLSRRVGGRSLTIGVGREGSERYGSCLARLALPRLAQGYLPILQTHYVDAQGTRYLQESFAVRPSEASSLVSFVRITADAMHARAGADVEISLTPGDTILPVPARTTASVYVRWSHASTGDSALTIDRASYDVARASVVRYWQGRLSEGSTIDVPERRVRDAARNLIIQNLGLGWRYSVGNAYQQFSYPEALDVAQVIAAYGFDDVAGAILRRSLSTPRGPYPNWRIGQRLVATALYYRLFRDRALVAALTPDLRAGVSGLGSKLEASANGLLARERFSSDVPDLVYGLHSQAVAWQGMREMGMVWGATGYPTLAAQSRRIASALEAGLRRAVRRSSRTLPDRSVFVPIRLLDKERPYGSVTEDRAGSYWNLVLPYALASGLFAPGGREAEGILDYLSAHGARAFGLVRAGAYSLYGRTARPPTFGVNPVYGLNVARFLADNDKPDQLVLSLYGQPAVGMTPGTFVAGEAVSVTPLGPDYFRSTYLPPNAASNASFLETLRLTLVHETRDRSGAPRGLELAYATPRAWLAPGRTISVRELPTSFGPISYSIESESRVIRVSVDVPVRIRQASLRFRFRLPPGRRIARVFLDGGELRRVGVEGDTIDLSGHTGRLVLVARIGA
jgi:hypothetical protein